MCGYGQKFATGRQVTFPAIAGHRDANFTDCPGGKLYAQLPSIRKVVARTGQPKIYGFVVEDPAISPNGDGVRDHATIGFTISQTATWRLDIRNGDGTLVRHMTGEGKVVETTWSGGDDDGKLQPDGVYTVEAGATSVDGEARSATDDYPPGHGRARHRERDRRAGPVQPQRRRPGRCGRARLQAGRGRVGARFRRLRRRDRACAA